MVTALPFLVVPSALAFDRLKRPAALAAIIGGVTMLAATITDPMLERSGNWGINAWAVLLADGAFVPNLPEIVFGIPRTAGLVFVLSSSAAALAAMLRMNRRLEEGLDSRPG